MPFLWAALVFYEGMLAAVVLYALLRGGPEERSASIALLVTAVGSQIVAEFGPRWTLGPEYGVMVFDAILTGLLLVIVYRSRKFWPLWAAAAALVGTVTHAARWLHPSLARDVYASIQPFWAFPVMLAIVIGTAGGRKNH